MLLVLELVVVVELDELDDEVEVVDVDDELEEVVDVLVEVIGT